MKNLVSEDKELPQLKALYDELWRDARTMIKDMNKSIFVYLLTSFVTLGFSAIMIGTAISDWNKILTGGASTLTYFYAIVETPGAIFYVAFGIILLYWHNQFKTRYSKLIKMEKELED